MRLGQRVHTSATPAQVRALLAVAVRLLAARAGRVARAARAAA